jgi:hypothetical protein
VNVTGIYTYQLQLESTIWWFIIIMYLLCMKIRSNCATPRVLLVILMMVRIVSTKHSHEFVSAPQAVYTNGREKRTAAHACHVHKLYGSKTRFGDFVALVCPTPVV